MDRLDGWNYFLASSCVMATNQRVGAWTQGRRTAVLGVMPMMRVAPASATMPGFYSADSALRQPEIFLSVARFWLATDVVIGDVFKFKQ